MMSIRIVAILIGIAIIFSLGHWLDARWYVAWPLGAVGYLIARYIGWAINERRNLNREKEEWLKEATRDR